LAKGKTLKKTAILVVVLATTFLSPVSQAQKKKLYVRIVNRQANESQYAYTVPGYSQTNCSVYVTGNYGNGSCTQTGGPAWSGSYSVSGATLSLLLPDGQLVVVNCNAKLNWTDWSTTNAHRSCRQPITDAVEAEFDGDKAKLEWPVSIDGKKKQTETYKIIGILSKIPTSDDQK
jgi:hypothetical protein